MNLVGKRTPNECLRVSEPQILIGTMMNISDKTSLGRLSRGTVHSYPRGIASNRFRKRHVLRSSVISWSGVAVNEVDAGRNQSEGDCGFARNRSSTSETYTRDRVDWLTHSQEEAMADGIHVPQ